jgi:peroxiredoxin
MASPISGVPKVGELAPELRLPTADGQVVSLTDAFGHPILVSCLSHAA